MNIQKLINGDVEFGVSEPSDFHIENGNGPYHGKIKKIEADSATIFLTRRLFYRGEVFTIVTARPRHLGKTFSDWEPPKVMLVNLVVNLTSITHMIGGLRFKKAP